MATKIYTGRDGKLLYEVGDAIGGGTQTEALKVRNWTLNTNLETLNVTTLNESHESFIPGKSSYSGNATLLYYQDIGANEHNVKHFLQKGGLTTTSTGVADSDKVRLFLRLYTGDAISTEFTLDAYVTSSTIGVNTGDIVSVDFNFQGTGKPLIANFL